VGQEVKRGVISSQQQDRDQLESFFLSLLRDQLPSGI